VRCGERLAEILASTACARAEYLDTSTRRCGEDRAISRRNQRSKEENYSQQSDDDIDITEEE